ncbi:MAG: glycine cleavage system protein GcvH [Acidimicrobiales bacterium]
MEAPENLHYTSEHEWVNLTGSNARVGITDYAQDALGDVVYVDLPAVGKAFQSNDVFGEIESTKSVSELYAPLSGKVVETNSALVDHPELVNSDPYGEGWLCVFEVDDAGEYDGLLSASAYRDIMSSEED